MIKELKNAITVDVGKHTAVVHWHGDAFPTFHEMIYKDKIKGNLSNYLKAMSEKFVDTIQKMYIEAKCIKFDFIQIEGIGLWDSVKSQTSAKKGDLFTVGYLVGVYFEIASCYCDNVRIITAPQWKGQLSKEGTEARVKRINGLVYPSEHVTDAVAMGFSNVEDIWMLKKKVVDHERILQKRIHKRKYKSKTDS